MFTEDELLPISALQHLAFCERQWALIHIEGAWAENARTSEGRLLHEKVHEEEFESRGECRTVRSLRLRSFQLGLTGQADVVEFIQTSDGTTVIPVEFKLGKPKIDNCDEVQLCAQALCLEEMLHVQIEEGFFFYGRVRRRHQVLFSRSLRVETEKLSRTLHALYKDRKTPRAVYEKKCESCSLIDICMPKLVRRKSARSYLESIITEEDYEATEGNLL